MHQNGTAPIRPRPHDSNKQNNRVLELFGIAKNLSLSQTKRNDSHWTAFFLEDLSSWTLPTRLSLLFFGPEGPFTPVSSTRRRNVYFTSEQSS